MVRLTLDGMAVTSNLRGGHDSKGMIERQRWNAQSIGQRVSVISTDHATFARRILVQYMSTTNRSTEERTMVGL